MNTKKQFKNKFLLKLSFCLILILLFLLQNNCFATTEENYKSLSDEDINPISIKVGWDSFRKNEIEGGGQISVKIEGAYYPFEKGLWAHANSTLIYDFSSYNYDYFTAYVGLNQTGSRSNGVIYKIYTSIDGKNWNIKYNEDSIVCKPTDNAEFVKIDIRTEKFLKLEADSNGSNASDHSVYADAKIIKEGYKEPGEELVPSIDELDRQIKEDFANENLEENKEFELILLKRELFSRVGNYALKRFLSASEENKETFTWLISDVNNIREYVLGGKPNGGNYLNSLMQLSRLYNEYKEDFELTEKLNNKYEPELTYGEFYKKMAISLSLTHSQNISLWMSSSAKENQSDALRRYAIYKYMHKNGMLRKWDGVESYAPMFEALQVEEMRLVFNGPIDDEEILWLNEYVQDRLDTYKQDKYITPHPYMAYVQPNYNNPVFYDDANRDYFNELFAIKDRKNPEETIGLFDLVYTIPGGNTIPSYEISVTRGTNDYKLQKVWMNFRNKFGTGAICGGISNSGANIRVAHGIPALFMYQPYHGVILNYAITQDGKGFWGIDNDVDGWTLTSSASIRMLLGWGTETWNIESPLNTQWLYMFKYNAVYMVLAQEAINDFDNLVKAEEQTFLAKVYEKDQAKKEEIYNKAIEKQNINLDAWVGLINTYKADSTKTEADYYNLAERIAEDFKLFPLPMKHLSNLIKAQFTSPEYVYQFTLLQTRTLTEASNYNGTEVVQPGLTKVEANFLLGRLDKTMATFSFDGEDAGKIVLASCFDGNGVRWDYSIVGKGENENWTKERFTEVSFTDSEEHKLLLSPEELANITADNDIYIHIVGVDYSDKNVYKIDITSQNLPTNLYANDWENKVMGITDKMEWRYTENDSWTIYNENNIPELTGNKTIQVRLAATGRSIPSPASEIYTFTEDNWPDTRKYIPIDQLSIHSYSTQSLDNTRPFYAPNAIDGNINTLWHTDFRQNVLQQSTKPFIAITLEETKNIKAIEFVQRKYRDLDPIFIKNAIIYVSNDGQSWIEAGRKENCEQNEEFKSVEFTEAMYGKYVKFEMETYDMFASLAMINLFEDETKVTHANFSFDGENGGKIVLTDKFKGTSWQYSLDGGNTWKQGLGDIYEIPKIELQQINSANGIKIRIAGNESQINIGTQEAPEISAYLNDLENRLIGVNNISNLEWKIEGSTEWTSYEEKEPIVVGNKKLLIRRKAVSTYTASDAVEFHFTEDNQTDNAKYIPIKHLSINSFSSTTAGRGEPAENAIDGLPTTMWHTNRTTSTMKDPRWIVIELDEPRYISKIEYVKKAQYAYGILKNGTVSVSMDGEDWEEACVIQNLYNPTTSVELLASENSKDIVFAESKNAKYIKIECTESCDYVHGNRDGVPMDYFFSAAMFNLFEDLTKAEHPIAEIEYSTTDLTNQNVTATLVNENMDITITNNKGSRTYTFDQNGEFTFEFVNSKGIKGTAKAEVTWICKTLPTPTIRYSTETLTNQDVTASITFDRAGTIIVDENGEEIENGNTYVFTKNGTHEFKFVGPYGNAGTAVAEVDWIDKVAPVASIEYSAEYKTNQDIIATIKFDKPNVRITNNDGNNTYTFTTNGSFTFEFIDKAGNRGTAVATVTNIDKTLPVATIEYDITDITKEDVTAIVTFDKEGVRIVNDEDEEIENGNTHVFTTNGTHEFKFIGPAGNKGVAVAEVTWIDKTAPKATITYDITNMTKEDVTATITFNEENVRITNNNGKNTYVFVNNGTFKFEFEDIAGNKGTAIADVEWIDKVELISKIVYDINDITNQDVTATITFNKTGVKILDSNGNEIENGDKYVFTENGRHEFKFVGPAGNKGTAIAEVTWIDKIPPAAIITYDIVELTNKNVVATVTFDEGGVRIVNENGEEIENGDTHEFTENGSYTFYYIGPLGNKGTAVANVNWIDKTAPTAEISYSTKEATKGNVKATLVNESEEIIVTNNDGSKEYTFDENGEFTFEFRDIAGNTGIATANVTWIDKDPDQEIVFDSEKYDIKEECIFNIRAKVGKKQGTTVKEFKENINTNQTVKIVDKDGIIMQEDDLITTSSKVKVGNNLEYTLIVNGDMDCDGEITVNDIAKMKLHLLKKTLLEGNSLKAANIDEEEGIEINDLARLKLILIGLRELN